AGVIFPGIKIVLLWDWRPVFSNRSNQPVSTWLPLPLFVFCGYFRCTASALYWLMNTIVRRAKRRKAYAILLCCITMQPVAMTHLFGIMSAPCLFLIPYVIE